MSYVSIYATLKDHASRQPEAEALVLDDIRVSYGELFESVGAFANWLVDNGLRPGKPTGICIADEVRHLTCAMALLCLGTPQMSLGSHEVGATRRKLAAKTGIAQLVVDKAESWMEDMNAMVAPSRYALSGNAATGIFPELPPDSIGLFHNTSGSTNIPKTFGMSLERIMAGAKRYADQPKERRALRTGSIEFDAHRHLRICSLLAGNTCVFTRDLRPRSIAALCERASVSRIHMNAYKLVSLARGATRECRLTSFTGIQSGGSRVPGHLRERVREMLTDDLWVLYATSETGMISRASPDQHERFPEGVGFLAKDITHEILSPTGSIVEPGEIGAIRVRKSTMSKGYLLAQGITSSNPDGWFYPGDLLSQAPEGPLIFHGRSDDVMILNGINIFPSAIEDILQSHPEVREAVAFPVMSRIHGEIPVAAVVLAAEASADASQLLDYCRRSLGMRAPRQIRVVESIPRNTGGKPLRRQLAES